MEKGVWNTESKTLIKKEFRNSKTGQNSYGYTIKNEDKNRSSDKKSKAYSIETGLYGWNGRCFCMGNTLNRRQWRKYLCGRKYLYTTIAECLS